ncbi:MAG: hypothetical protein GY696_12065 [Gammaproteobacteria bacterium]|nr:hypothetical protein [Gammaproteobacteria bacterium]
MMIPKTGKRGKIGKTGCTVYHMSIISLGAHLKISRGSRHFGGFAFEKEQQKGIAAKTFLPILFPSFLGHNSWLNKYSPWQ